MIKSRKMRWAGHVTHMGGKVNVCKVLKALKEGDHLEDVGVDGGLVLKWILKKYAERVWIVFI